ncbi:gp76 [Alphaproteobacteria phage PhiJL001]|uniref:Gp76 n=1 Tax=Alphaproteobacteria phage PhiJL001 TaxID=2681607 RepID=Q5DN29_9CAUD|nr:gp76 [Alphaproteobacteria phage PhiJL001]AAT69472.1 gp76 [Alphaproteobacteria phage PhiJL001]
MTAAQADKAKIQVDAKGRSVTFVQLDTTASDSTKPWRGDTAPRSPAADEEVLSAVFVPATGGGLGLKWVSDQLLKRAEQVALVAPGSAFTKQLENFDEILESDGSRWRIEMVEILQPADVRILYAIGVKR